MLSVRDLTKIYKLNKKKGGGNVIALNNVSIDFPDTGLVFLLGKSGSGKSTLLNAIGGLDTFDEGEIVIKGKSSKDFKQSDFDSYRNTFIGFIFQEYNILEEFSIGKNLSLALELQGKKAGKNQVEDLLEKVDLKGFYKRKPNQLSGGQKQRVAIARALIKDPEIIMADEPTGALDSNTGKQVMDTLKKLSKTKLVIIVSHDREFAEIYGDRVVELKDGHIISDQTKKEVLAQKTSSGVSFIDNKIIHIKKGQAITKDDLLKINRLMVQNIKQGDTIISLDSKSNTEVKRAAAITDDGNREVFKETKPEDVKQQQHDPKDFKLIKSRLKFKDSFKIGVSSLKHKPIRLIFTILLACVAFCMFGLVDTLASYNRATSVYESLNMLDVKTYAISKSMIDEYGYNSGDMPMDKSDLNRLHNSYKDYNFQTVIYQNKNFSLRSNDGGYYNYINLSNINNEYSSTLRSRISGMMALNNNIKTAFNLEILYGRMPTEENEICISSNIYDTIVERTKGNDAGSKITKFEDFETNKILIRFADDKDYSIVGVVKDDTDISKYKNSDNGDNANNIKDYLSSQEVDTILSYGLTNMCYVSDSTFANLAADYSGGSSLYYCYQVGEYRYSINADNIGKVSSIQYTSDVKLKDGVSLSTLKANQAIVSSSFAESLGSNTDAIMKAINDGAKIAYTYYSTENVAFELEIVGLYDNYYGLYVTDEFYQDLHSNSFDYVLTRAKGTSSDKHLVSYIENYKKDNVVYSIQFASTAMFDNFSSMITSMTKPFLYVGIGLAVFAGFMLMNFIATSISYKKREIGVLRAIGARGKDVFFMFFWESLVICIINFILASIGCGIACYFINKSLLVNLGFNITLLTFGVRQLLLMFAVSFGVAFISSFIPVYKIAHKNPIDSINNR